MSNERRHKRRRIHPAIKFLFSSAAIAFLLYLAGFAFRYCLGLFIINDDYILQIPGKGSPIVEVVKEDSPENSDDPDNVIQTGRATILVAGDIMTHMPVVRSGKAGDGYDFSSIFAEVKSYISAADYAVVNLETTLSGTAGGREYTGYPDFNAPDAIATSAAISGFDMMLTGNNRCYDYGTSGMLRTLETVRNAGLDTLGTKATVEENDYLVKDLNGVKVGMVCYTFADIEADRNTPIIDQVQTDSKAAGLINVFDYGNLDMFYAEMENHISAMEASGADAIVLYIHWGDDFSVKPSNSQKAMAQRLCDLGVDVIVGSHPHVIQPIELLTSTDGAHQTLCAYSLGNFLSNQRADNIGLTTGHSEDGLMLQFTLAEYSNGAVYVESVELIPTWVLIRGSDSNKTYHILPLNGSVDQWKNTFDLSSAQFTSAQKSLERTNALVDSSLKYIQSILLEQAAQRGNETGFFTGGVG